MSRRRRMLTAALLGTVALLTAEPRAASALTCSPSMNGPGTVAPGTVVAPYLRELESSYGIGDCDTTIAVTARSADGTLWGVDMGDGKNTLWTSTDDLATWQLVYQADGYASIERVLPLASGSILIVVRDAQGLRHILRSTDASGTAFGATPSLDMPSGAYLHSDQSWMQMGDAVYVAEYGDPVAPVVLWKSTDDGRSFSVVYSRSDIRHFHAVQADPYRIGRIWVTIGDTGGQPRIGYSDDGGTTFTWITEVTYPQSRALALMFTLDAVYWGTDTPDVPSPVMRWDRTTGAITPVMTALNGPFYNTWASSGIYAQLTAVERPVEDGYIGDDHFHVLTSKDATSWSFTRTPFVRQAGDTHQVAKLEHFTAPDDQGRFWGAFFDLNGTQFKSSNVLFQLDPTATYDGANARFSTSPARPATGQPVGFDGSASSSPNGGLSYAWTFGDGSTGTGVSPSHTYGAAGGYTVRLQVADSRGDANELTHAVTVTDAPPPPPAPTATTGTATAITSSGATLAGSVNPNGSATSVRFDYGTTTAYGSQTAAQDAGSGTQAQPLTAAVSGLQPGTTYHFRVVATSSAGTTNGSDATFTTAAPPATAPTATTSTTVKLSAKKAQFAGTVNPGGAATTYYFEYGPTTAYGTRTANTSAGSGRTTVSVTAQSGNLVAGTTYHVRLAATNSVGTTLGNDVTFTAR